MEDTVQVTYYRGSRTASAALDLFFLGFGRVCTSACGDRNVVEF